MLWIGGDLKQTFLSKTRWLKDSTWQIKQNNSNTEISNDEKTKGVQQLKQHKLAMFYDLAVQCFIESSISHIQFQHLFREAINHHIMLSVYMLEDHRRDELEHIIYFITPMHQRWNIKGGKSVEPRNNNHRVAKD